MKQRPVIAVLVFAFCFAAGFGMACVPGFDLDELDPEDFDCDEDEDCLDGEVCEDGVCTEPEGPQPDCVEDEDCAEDEVCENQECVVDPDTLECDMDDEDYPPEEPLPIPEKCDGLDTNCDGDIDGGDTGLVCESDDDCPDQGHDIYGTELDVECDDGVCSAYYRANQISCSGYTCLPPGECPEGAEGCFEPLHDDLGCPDGNSPPENNDEENNDAENNDEESED